MIATRLCMLAALAASVGFAEAVAGPAPGALVSEPPRRVEIDKSNVFPDLCYYRGYYYLAFKHGESKAHNHGDVLILMRSTDGVVWTEVARLGSPDPKVRISVPAFAPCRDHLAILTNPIAPDWARSTAVAVSADGEHWSPFRTVLSPHQLWRPRFHQGHWYAGADVETKPPQNINYLFRSKDCLKWERVCQVELPRPGSETNVCFLADGRAALYIRTTQPQTNTHLYAEAREPFGNWTATEKDTCVQGLHIAALDERRLGISRYRYTEPKVRRVAQYWLDDGNMQLIGFLPSGPSECGGTHGFVQTGPDRGIVAYYTGPGDFKIHIAPIRWRTEGPTLEPDPALAASAPLARLPVETVKLPRPELGAKATRTPFLTVFQDALYAMWSARSASGERVYTSKTLDGTRWSRPESLLTGADSSATVSAGGWHVHNGKLVAYSTRVKSAQPENERVLDAAVSTCGVRWMAASTGVKDFVVTQSPRRVGPGRLLMAGESASGKPRLLWSDEPSGLDGWREAAVDWNADGPRLRNPTFFERWDDAIVILLRDDTGTTGLYATMSRDWGRNWSRPIRTAFPGAGSAPVAGNLPDGGVCIIGKPSAPAPLTVSVSNYGVKFKAVGTLATDSAGDASTSRSRDLQPPNPQAIIWRGKLYIARIINGRGVVARAATP